MTALSSCVLKVAGLALLTTLSGGAWAQSATTINITDAPYSAVPNDGLDDTRAFMLASSFINDRHGNVTLLVPAGTYNVGQQLPASDPAQAAWLGGNNVYLYAPPVVNVNGCSNVFVRGLISNGQKPVLLYNSGMKYGAFDPQTGNNYTGGSPGQANKAFMGGVFNIENSTNVSVSNLELDGNIQGIIKGGNMDPVDGIQLGADGFDVVESRDVTIDSVSAHHFGRDGILVKNYAAQSFWTQPHNTQLRDCSFEYNARQGLSWISGVGLQATRCKFNHTGRAVFSSSPSAGVDIEPDNEPGLLAINGVFTNCEFVDNLGVGLISDGDPYATSGFRVSSMTFDNCLFWGTSNAPILVVQPSFRYTGCQIYGTIYKALATSVGSQKSLFTNCAFENKPYNGQPCFQDRALLSMSNTYPRGLNFDRCSFLAHDLELLFLENYNLSNCNYTAPSSRPTFATCTFRRDSSTPTRTSTTVLRGIDFNGYTTLDHAAPATGPGTHFLQDVVFTGESGVGSVAFGGNGDIYQVPCPGAVIGGNATERFVAEIKSGVHFQVLGQGQLLIENNSELIVRSGAVLELGQSSDFMIQGKVTVEPGAHLIIHPTAKINPYNTARIGELNIQPGAILGGRANFTGVIDGINSGPKVCVTGNHPEVTSVYCGTETEARTAKAPAAAKAQATTITAYPVPFTDVLTVELPQNAGDIEVRVLDSFGRLVLTQRVAAGKATVQLGQNLASGQYLVQLVAQNQVSQTKVIKQ